MTEITLPMIIIINKFDPGGGGSLPLEAVPDAREKMWKGGISKSGVGAERADRGNWSVKIVQNGRKG